MPSEREDDLLDIISDAIDESMDVDWTSRDGARHVLGALQIGGYLATPPPTNADALGEVVERILDWFRKNQDMGHVSGPVDNCLIDGYFDLNALATAALSAMSPAGWIVGNADGTQWRTWEDGLPLWTGDIDHACRYARRIDAESAHQEDEDAWRIVPYTKGPRHD